MGIGIARLSATLTIRSSLCARWQRIQSLHAPERARGSMLTPELCHSSGSPRIWSRTYLARRPTPSNPALVNLALITVLPWSHPPARVRQAPAPRPHRTPYQRKCCRFFRSRWYHSSEGHSYSFVTLHSTLSGYRRAGGRQRLAPRGTSCVHLPANVARPDTRACAQSVSHCHPPQMFDLGRPAKRAGCRIPCHEAVLYRPALCRSDGMADGMGNTFYNLRQNALAKRSRTAHPSSKSGCARAI